VCVDGWRGWGGGETPIWADKETRPPPPPPSYYQSEKSKYVVKVIL